MVLLFEKPELIAPDNIQLGGIKFQDSPRIWLDPAGLRALDQLYLAYRRGGTDARKSFDEYMAARSAIYGEIWERCLEGQFSVRARVAGKDNVYHWIASDGLASIWPLGPLHPNPEYERVELFGPLPPWIKLTVDHEFCLPEYLVAEFQHTDDFTFVIIRGHEFELGCLQASIVRILHHAATTDPQQWRSERQIQNEVGCSAISDIFKRHSNWNELIERVGRGKYQLNLHSRRGHLRAIGAERDF